MVRCVVGSIHHGGPIELFLAQVRVDKKKKAYNKDIGFCRLYYYYAL